MKTFFKTIAAIYMLAFSGLTDVTAQQTFFEALDAQGTSAKYQIFGTYKNDKGKQVVTGSTGLVSIEKTELEELNAGIIVNRTDDGKTSLVENYNAKQKKAIDFVGYPNTRMIYNSRTGHGFVAIDNYVFLLRDIERGHTGFGTFGGLYIVDGSASESSSGKKKKKGKFWNKLKEAALNQTPQGQGSGPEYDMAMELDLEQYVRDYLKEMKAIADAYMLTAKDKDDIARLKQAASNDTKLANRKNAEFWASAEGQAIKENQRRAAGASKTNDVTLKNNSNSTIYIGSNGSNNPGTKLSPRGTASWSCSQDAYIQKVSKSGSSTSYKSTTNRVYSANSGCGRIIAIN